MTESFEIGVSLALQDGVSDAILKAQRDMAALERTMHDGGISVQALREVGARAASVPVADRSAAVSGKAVLRGVPEAPLPVSQALGKLAPAVPLAAPAPVVVDKVGSAPQSEVIQSPAVRSLASGFVQAPASPSVGETRDSGAPAAPAMIVREPDLPRAPVADKTAEAQLVAPQQILQRIFVESHEAEAPLPDRTGVPTGDLAGRGGAAAPAGREEAKAAAPVVRRLALADVPSGAASAPWQADEAAVGAGAEGGEPAWASVPAAEQGGLASAFAHGPAPAAGPAAPPPTPRDTGPQGGDVFLDGMKVGRWMSRLLDREADRASAGPTGFDPRRGRLLPGVTVGG